MDASTLAALAIAVDESRAAAVRELMLDRERAAMANEDARSFLAQRHYTASQQVPDGIFPMMSWEAAHARQHNGLLQARDARDLASLDQALRVPPAAGMARPASLSAQTDKRATLELAIDALMASAPVPLPQSVALPAAGSPYGTLQVDTQACTLCLSCVGACPEAALADNPNAPQLRFIEKNCVQCGLCVKTCPESALTLEPRLWLADEGRARKQHRVINEAEPFHCVSCGKPFGTLRAIEAMIGKIGAHPAFSGDKAQRLRMCGDCRVNAMFSDPNERRITDV